MRRQGTSATKIVRSILREMRLALVDLSTMTIVQLQTRQGMHLYAPFALDELEGRCNVVTLCSWDRKQSKLVVRCAFDQNAKDGVVDKAELQFFELSEGSIDKKGY